jgi:O-antigen/teichoic acid export membrane protein
VIVPLIKSYLSQGTSRETLWSILITVVYSVLTPLGIILLARWLGAAQFGVYAFAMAVVTLLAIPAGLGLPSVVIRFVSEYHFRGDWARIRGLLGFANRSVLVASLVLMALLVLVAGFPRFGLDSEYRYALYLAAPLVVLLGLEELRSAALKGVDRVLVGQIPEMVVRPAVFLAGVLVLMAAPVQADAQTALWLYLTAALVAFVLWVRCCLLRTVRPHMRGLVAVSDTPVWVRTALPLLLLGGVQIIGAQMDLILLGLYRSSEETGVYRATFQVAQLVTFAWIAVNTVIAPKLSRLQVAGDRSGLQTLVVQANRVTFVLALPVALVCLVAGEQVLGLVFGVEYRVGYLALSILVGGRLVNALLGSSSTVMRMTGLERQALRGIVAGTLVNLVLNVLLIPRWGIEGAAVASTAGLVVWNVMLAVEVRRRLNIRILSAP